MNQKGISPILLLLVIAGILIIGAGVWYYWVQKTPVGPAICPTDTKICPDGAAVRRISPACEFESCPEVKKDETANWKSFTNMEFGYSFKYPSNYIIKEYGTDVQVYESSNSNVQYLVDFYGQKTNATLSSIIKDKTDGRVLSEARLTTINGLSAYEGVDQGIVSWYAVFVKNNSNLVEIIFGSTDRGSLQQNKAALTNTQKQILSTFKFTN